MINVIGQKAGGFTCRTLDRQGRYQPYRDSIENPVRPIYFVSPGKRRHLSQGSRGTVLTGSSSLFATDTTCAKVASYEYDSSGDAFPGRRGGDDADPRQFLADSSLGRMARRNVMPDEEETVS